MEKLMYEAEVSRTEREGLVVRLTEFESHALKTKQHI